jgi:PAS domain S-box-containing protein
MKARPDLMEAELDRVPSPLEDLVGSSDFPLDVVELPSGKVLLTNAAMTGLLGTTPEELVGSTILDLVVPERRHSSEAVLRALADGTLTGFQAVRSSRANDGPAQELAVWMCAVEVEGRRVGLRSAAAVHGAGTPLVPLTAALNGWAPGQVLVGTLDRDWRIDRVSHEVVEMLGYQPAEAAGFPVLGALHPGDTPWFLAAVEHARTGRGTVRATVRVRAKSGDWARLTAVLATLTDDYPPALAFTIIASLDEGLTSRTEGSRLGAELHRGTRDLRVAGMISRLGLLPDVSRLPALSSLTAREWEILVHLLEGERVAAIAADLRVSQSTVRNHLSSVFSKLGVNSQAQLIRKLRTHWPARG